jgi:hypothetical protein
VTTIARRLADLPDGTTVVEEVAFVSRLLRITHQGRAWLSGVVDAGGEHLPFEVYAVDYDRHVQRFAGGGMLLASGVVDRRSGEPVLRIKDVLA